MSSPTAGPVGRGALLAGRYRLEDLLADSDGARFWRATDTVLARSVAVHAVGADDDRAPGLMEAARLSATVNDPHLLRVLDADDAEGVCWVVHEWGEGISLDLMLQRGPLAPTRAAWLAKEVAHAVAAGHAQGVAHGRLNPEAVLVTHGGAVKLIGYVVDASLHHAAPVSPVYGELDAREADVIDVASVLYAALTGRWPGVSPSEVPAAPLEGQRPMRPRQVRAGVPRLLDAICERVLHREGSRHELPVESAAEIAAALADYTGEVAASDPVALLPDGTQDQALDQDGPDGPDGATSVLPRAALAQEARERSAPSPGTDTATVQVPAPAATSPGDRDEAVDLDDTQGDGVAVPDDRSDDRRDGAAAASATAPPLEATALHREPLEGPDTVSPMRAPDPVPAPPPLEDSPERPLFATTQRRVPAARATEHTGSTTPPWAPAAAAAPAAPAQAPGYWPFDREARPEATRGNGREGRGWLRTAIVVGVLLFTGVAMIAAFTLGRGSGLPLVGGGDDPEATPAPQLRSVSIASATDFDPLGDDSENPDQAGNVIDGDPATTWSTVTYYNRPDLGGLKSGVGLVLELGEEQRLRELTVRFGTAPTSFEVYAAPEGATQPPTSLDGLTRVGGQDDAPERATVRLDPAPTTRYLVVWLTNLPSAPGGYRGEIAEVNVRA